MLQDLRELWRFRDLLRQLVTRELKVRYKNSAFGFLWSIVPPILQVLVYSFLVKGVFNLNAPNYSAYLLCGVVPWTYFTTAIMDSGQTLLVNYPIIKKVYLPREVFPLCSAISNFVHFLLGWGVYFCFFFLIRGAMGQSIPVLPTLVWFPFITLMVFFLIAGLTLWMSILSLFYEDIKFIVQTFMNLFMFVLPILVPADVVRYSSTMSGRDWLFHLYMLNPITAFIEAYRKTILERLPVGSLNMKGAPLTMQWGTFAGACCITLLLFFSGYAYFNHRKWEIVERY